MNPRRIEQLTGQWRWHLGLRDGFFALGGAAIVATLSLAWTTMWLPLAVVVFMVTLAIRLAWSRPWMLDPARIVQHLDRTYPDLEESSALWLRAPESLSLLERLQLRRIDTAISWVIPDNPPPGEPPRGFLRPAMWCGAGGLLLWGAAWLFVHGARVPGTTTNATPARHVAPLVSARPAAPVWPKIIDGSMTVTPPVYTCRPPRRTQGFNAGIEEGSTVTWTLALDRPVREARLVFGEGAADLPLQPGDHGLTATRVVTDTGLYHLAAVLPNGSAWNPPELYSLKVNKDQPPTVRVLQPAESRTIIEPASPPPRVAVEVLAGDDYGIGEAHLVVTVAKGSGEAVKFREQSLPFDTDAPADADAPHGRRFARTLDLGALGMEPGDELYFFVEAHDNRQPAPNRTRSETRFVVLRGPDEKATTQGRGVAGVNLLPQYFRSERQIIIDTEKLLADHPTISDHDFRERANDLGIDQQLLRLRYGQFLGEELENGAVTDHAEVNLNPLQAAVPQGKAGPHAAASIAQRFQQEHVDQDRGTGGEDGANPRSGSEHPLNAGEIRKPFVDSHDTQDAATLFDRDTKGTMKDVIAAMWDAEGDLRTARPADALAPEHRALDILKDLQQSARAYVQHVGFEPAPLKIAERRLKGDATGAPTLGLDRDALSPDDPALGEVRAALASVPSDDPGGALPTATLEGLRGVETTLTAAATRRPEIFLEGLQVLRRLRAGEPPATPETWRTLERALWKLLPPATPLPARARESSASLAEAYFKALADEESKR